MRTCTKCFVEGGAFCLGFRASGVEADTEALWHVEGVCMGAKNLRECPGENLPAAAPGQRSLSP